MNTKLLKNYTISAQLSSAKTQSCWHPLFHFFFSMSSQFRNRVRVLTLFAVTKTIFVVYWSDFHTSSLMSGCLRFKLRTENNSYRGYAN